MSLFEGFLTICNSTGWLMISAVSYRRRHPDSRNEIMRKKSKWWMIRFQLGCCRSLDVSIVWNEKHGTVEMLKVSSHFLYETRLANLWQPMFLLTVSQRNSVMVSWQKVWNYAWAQGWAASESSKSHCYILHNEFLWGCQSNRSEERGCSFQSELEMIKLLIGESKIWENT